MKQWKIVLINFPQNENKFNDKQTLHISEYHIRIWIGNDLPLIQGGVGVSFLVGRLCLQIVYSMNINMHVEN